MDTSPDLAGGTDCDVMSDRSEEEEVIGACEELWRLHYHSHRGTHNMYHKDWPLTEAGTVTQCYRNMGPWHCAGEPSSIRIMKVEETAVGKCKWAAIKFHDSKIKFLLPHPAAIHHREAQYLLLDPEIH
ncbi:hypothetical protein A6R68_05163 [Neotoma lepida]|uniref:Uncharacterized protein n=1 Tax=Neotoma lepida TaxID=56216 RepID=A0A1A6GJA9_NEOLE|nr:hypothetical protein A6R68_05163 [Neotoma lepida]